MNKKIRMNEPQTNKRHAITLDVSNSVLYVCMRTYKTKLRKNDAVIYERRRTTL